MSQFTTLLVVREGALAHLCDRTAQQAFPSLDERRRGFRRLAPQAEDGAGSLENSSATRLVAPFEAIEHFREIGVIAARMNARGEIVSQFSVCLPWYRRFQDG